MIRASIRAALLLAWSLTYVAVLLPVVIVSMASARACGRLGPALMQIYSRVACRILGVRIEQIGRAPGDEPAFVAPNHWGYIDVFVLGALYRSSFVSRADVRTWPVVGWFVRAGGTVFIRRESRRDAARVVGDLVEALRRGRRVTAFLEGGAGRGDVVRTFKSPLVEAAVATQASCVPVAVGYRLPGDPELDPNSTVAWIDGGFVEHLWRLMRVKRIDARVAFLPPRTGADRKTLAHLLEADVRAALTAA